MKWKLAKEKRKCPRCGKYHHWPTDDKLCRKCEEEWVDSLEYKDALISLGMR
jgi:NMD protein affecting ribosome stability and mRNA decay